MVVSLLSPKKDKPVEEFNPGKYAKSDCKFCHGTGWMNKAVAAGSDLTIIVTCVCVKKRI